MKNLIAGLVLVVSSVAFAAKDVAIFPNVYNYGNSVQVHIWNTSNRSVWCSGSVYMNLDNGQTQSENYSEYVMANFNSYKMIYPRLAGARILSISHSIFCN